MVYNEFLFIRFLIVTFLLNFSGLSQSDNLQLLLQKMQVLCLQIKCTFYLHVQVNQLAILK